VMEDIILLDAVERYLSGQMLPEEKAYFQKLRENTPEIDQMVVEHKLFLHQINEFADHTALKQTISEVHTNLSTKGDIHEGGELTTRGKVIQLFHRYKKITAIAASIAGITALTISILVAAFSPAINNTQFEQLNKKLDNFQRATNAKIKAVDNKIPQGAITTTGGTAFLIDGKGYLITNAHVLNGSSAVVVNSKGQEFTTRIVNIDKTKDLAILKIDDDDFKPMGPLPYSIKKGNVDLGEDLFTLGYPRDIISCSLGYLSAESGFNGDTTSCQISLNANPGNSGSPVFNKNGDVVGILTAKQTEAEGVVFAVKAKGIYKLIDELKESDTSVQKIRITNSTSLRGESRVDQIKKVQDYVFLVKAYNQK